MKVLITGSTSKIGQRLIESLIKGGLNFGVLRGDLLNRVSLLEEVKGANLVVHLAAITHSNQEESYWEVNVKGTDNLVQAAKQAGVKRFIFISTRAINPKGGSYSQSKLAAEEIVKNSGIDWVVLRPAEVYGIGRGEMIEQLIKLVKRSYFVPIINNKKYPLAPLYVDDLVDALRKVILKDNLVNKIYTLTGPESFSFKDLVNRICHFYHLKRFKIYLPVFLLKVVFWILKIIPSKTGLAYDQLNRLLSEKSTDISLAKKDLDFNPIKFQKGLDLLK